MPREDALPELFSSLIERTDLATAIPATLLVLERDPVASAGGFRGDLLRALMGIGGQYWTAHPTEYDRYRGVVRAAALVRRYAREPSMMEFWSPLDDAQPGPAHATPRREARD